MKPLAIDLFCGKGGWTEGLEAAGWQVIGFDIEQRGYPSQLVLQDVATIEARKWRGKVQLICASPPCQAYSYRAMPWKRAKSLPPPDNTMFESCFRIAKEAGCPLIVENVVGAQRWVGRAKWHFGSFYLWGDVPALMPAIRHKKNTGGSWFGQRDGKPLERNDPKDVRLNGNGEYENAAASGGWNHPGKALDGIKQGGSGPVWFDSGIAKLSSRSSARKEASALIAKIPFDLAFHIGKVFLPEGSA